MAGSGWVGSGAAGWVVCRVRVACSSRRTLYGAVVHAVEAGFVAGNKGHRPGLVGLRGVGLRELDACVTVGEFLCNRLLLADHFAVEVTAVEKKDARKSILARSSRNISIPAIAAAARWKKLSGRG